MQPESENTAARISLRQCSVADAEALALIGSATLLDAFAGILPGESLLAHCRKTHAPSAWANLLVQPTTRAWLAEMAPGAAPIGYSIVTAPDFPPDLLRPEDLELRRIYLLSRFKGTGVGKLLLQRAAEYARQQAARRLLLGVHPENFRALAFYARNGFQKIGTRTFQVGASTFEDPVLALTL